MAAERWRTRYRVGALFVAFLLHVVNGYEEMYTISHLSPKSMIQGDDTDIQLETSHLENLEFNLEPSVLYHDRDTNILIDNEQIVHERVERSADPVERRSINMEDIPTSNNNEIDSEIELKNNRKYYEILPTKTRNYMHEREEAILPSEGFGDRLDFRFPGEGDRVPKQRALRLSGPKINPTAVQPIFATATPKEQGRQNQAEIQNIITGIVKLLNGNVNVQANSQLINGRPGRPPNSRINDRGPPRISNVPPLPEFDKPVTNYPPTKTPPPYPFDRPPHHGVNLPEQIVPPVRPGFHRPLPPWHRPRPRPVPNRRPNPNSPSYKPVPIHSEKPTDDKNEDVLILGESEANHSENTVHHDIVLEDDDDKEPSLVSSFETNTTTVSDEIPETTEKGTTVVEEKDNDTTSTSTTTTTTSSSTTTTTEKPKTTTESEKTTEEPTTTPSTTTTTTSTKEKPTKIEKEKKKDIPTEKDKIKDSHIKVEKNSSSESNILEPSITDKPVVEETTANTPTERLPIKAPAEDGLGNFTDGEKESINSQPIPASTKPYSPYRPRPGIVLDDPDFKPHGVRHREPASLITAVETRLPGGYGEIFDVTVSAIQGPGDNGGGASVHIQNVPIHGHGDHDDIIVTPSGEQGFVSIDGKRTYLNLFGEGNTAHQIEPTRVQRPVGATASPPNIGTGIAIPSDEELPQSPVRAPHHGTHHPAPNPHGNRPGVGGSHAGLGTHGHAGQRPQGYRRPQPPVRIDTCIVGDDSTCDVAQNEKCRTESGISSCICRAGYARRPRAPCRRVVALVLALRADRLYDKKLTWDMKLADRDSELYQQLSYEALRAIDSAFSMTPFSDDFVSGTVNSIVRGDHVQNPGIFVNFTIQMQETAETIRSSVATDIHKHLLGVIRRRSNNVGASALWVDSPAGSVLLPTDLDECASQELNDCHKMATCTNVWGGFRCACPSTTLDAATGHGGQGGHGQGQEGRNCLTCSSSHCSDRGTCQYSNGEPYCSCNSGYYGSRCAVDGGVVGSALGATLAAAAVIALTLAALVAQSRKWSREAKAAGMGSPVFSYMGGANTIKTPPVGGPPYQISIEERMRWAQIAEAMAANHYAPEAQTMATRPSSAMFGAYPTLPPVPMPRSGLYMGNSHHGTLNTVASRMNNATSHQNLYAYTNHAATESTSSEASSHVAERADLLVPRPKSRARSMHNQTGIYYDVEYENAPEGIYGTKGIPLSTYTVSRGPPFYRS